jgi:hypothetical protein
MAYTKKIARHDKVMIDGTDASNAFRQIGFTGTNAVEDVTGFSATGNAEEIAGRTTTGFSGEFYYTEESAALIYPIFQNREVVEMSWQPDGLVDATREIYIGNVNINEFSPSNTVGSVMTSPFSATAADEDGITATDFT